jgi:anti-sigma factor RsiW
VSCTEPRARVDAYLDGELDLVASLDMEAHLGECATCSRAYDGGRRLRSSLRTSELRFRAPGDLRRRVYAGLPPRDAPARTAWRRLSLGAAVALAAALVLVVWPELGRRGARDPLIDEIVSGHVRSLMADHLTDVASSDKHTVKPWFDGKLDFSPAIVDLADHGFPLVGGRLDYLGGRSVAALVYGRQRHFINLFVWPSAKEDPDERSLARHGFEIVHWWQGGMSYWAVSDLNAAELGEFAALVKEKVRHPLPSGAAGPAGTAATSPRAEPGDRR